MPEDGPRSILFNAVAGAGAGVLAATFVCPLDVVKTRLQVERWSKDRRPPAFRWGITSGILRQIFREEGVRGLYRGLSPTTMAIIPNWAVYFTVYELLKERMGDENNSDPTTKPKDLSPMQHVFAAAGAGGVTCLLTYPVWVVKTRLQTQRLRPELVQYTGTFSALYRIAHEEGIRGLYSGLVPSLMGITHLIIQFPAHEKFKTLIAAEVGTPVDKLSSGYVSLSAGAAEFLASSIVYPNQVIGSRLQEQGHSMRDPPRYSGVIDCFQKTLKHEGAVGFYRGYATNLVRTIPCAMITLTTHDIIQKYLKEKFSERSPIQEACTS
jgi:solute carrier family 25 folate transporter 32